MRKHSKGRGVPARTDWTTAEHLEQIRRESMPSILTLAMVRDNPNASPQTRAKAAEVLLKLNPDLEVSKKIEAEVVHHHVVEIQQIEGLQSIMNEIAPPAIETTYQETTDGDASQEEA